MMLCKCQPFPPIPWSILRGSMCPSHASEFIKQPFFVLPKITIFTNLRSSNFWSQVILDIGDAAKHPIYAI